MFYYDAYSHTCSTHPLELQGLQKPGAGHKNHTCALCVASTLFASVVALRARFTAYMHTLAKITLAKRWLQGQHRCLWINRSICRDADS